MRKRIIETTAAPAAIGPYSQAVELGNLLFISGQIPIDPVTSELVLGDITMQTRRVMTNISGILRSQNLDFSDLIKVTIYLTDMANFDELNKAYGGYFSEDPPARACVQVAGLPKGASVEIEAIASMPHTI